MLELLASVVNEGTGRAARVSGTVFGKTGTTQEHRDAWFVGFSGDLVVGVWVGNDDNTPTKGVTGGSLPAAIWRDFVSQAAPLRGKAQPVARLPASPSETTGTASRASESAPVSPSARRPERVLGPDDFTCERDRRGRQRCRVRDPDSAELVPPNDGERRSSTRELRIPEERDRYRSPRPGRFAPDIARDRYRAPFSGGPLDLFGGGR
jgi:membrane peptidoglycan carboxypeptidase